MPQSTAASPLMQFFPLILIFIIFYFLMIRPEKQKAKAHQKMLASIAANDKVVTSSGIHGTVVNVKEKTLILRIDDDVKIEIERNSIAYIKNPKVE